MVLKFELFAVLDNFFRIPGLTSEYKITPDYCELGSSIEHMDTVSVFPWAVGPVRAPGL